MRMNENCELTQQETIQWIMFLLECSDAKNHNAIVDRLSSASDDDLLAIRKTATTSKDSLRAALLSNRDIQSIVFACSLINKQNNVYSVTSILGIMDALKHRGIGLKNAEVHARASKRFYVIDDSSIDYEKAVYSNNTGLMLLVEEYPDRMEEIMDFRVKRQTNDTELIREYLTLDKPLGDGAL